MKVYLVSNLFVVNEVFLTLEKAKLSLPNLIWFNKSGIWYGYARVTDIDTNNFCCIIYEKEVME